MRSGIDLVVGTRCILKARLKMKSIRDITKLMGVTESALRYYNSKGVLQPTVRNKTGRRQWLYSEADIKRLKLILLYRKLGISVDDIALLLEDESRRKDILKARLSSLESEKKELDEQAFIIRILELMEDDERLINLLEERENGIYK